MVLIVSKYLLLKQTHAALLEEKVEKLSGISRMLDEKLAGSFNDILDKAGVKRNSSRLEKLLTLNEALMPFARAVVKSFPRVAVGYFAGDLDAVVVYEPREETGNMIGAAVAGDDIGREAIREKRELVGIVTNLRGDTLNCVRPIIRGGEAIGFVTANERIEDIYTQLVVNANIYTRRSNLWPVIGLNTFLWITAKVFLDSIYFQEAVVKYHNDDLAGELDKFLAAIRRYIEILYNNLDIGIVLCGDGQKVIYFNQFIEKNFVYVNCNNLSLNLEGLLRYFQINNRARVSQLLSRFNNKSVFYETLTVSLNGEEFDINVTGNSLIYGKKLNGSILLMEDSSKMSSKDEQLSRVEKFALIGEVAAAFAHEIRNPLTIVGGSIELIPERIEDKDFLISLSKVTKKEFGRVNKTIENLLEFIRYSEPIYISVNVNALVMDCIDFIRIYAKNKGIFIKENYFKELPEIFGDPEHLRQALLNLLINAFQAMAGGGVLTVNTAYKPGTGYIKISITDTGKGIPESIQDKVFDIFFTTKEHGSGLGLAIVHRIIDAHNGFIEFQSAEEVGTVFTVNLPIKKVYY
jgi:two-component system sensor histidine kinase AtoS